MAEVMVRELHNAVGGQTVVYTLYPVVGAGVVAGTQVTSGAGAWGADKELIAANAITVPFYVCAMDLDTAAVAQPFVIELEEAGATSIFAGRIDVTAATLNLGRIGVPYPVLVIANTQITARASGTAAKTINVSVLVATGLFG